MRLASVFLEGRPAVVAVDGERTLLVARDAEIGVDHPPAELWAAARGDLPEIAADGLVWRPVVPSPRRVVCLGLNYASHVEETGRELPTYPVLFTKWASSLVADGASVVLPPEAQEVDFEAELAVVIGRGGRRIAPGDALAHVGGVTLANDITMRDYQYKTHQWLQGKAWDASTPLGPHLVALDDIGDVGELDIRLTLNGEEMQSANTRQLMFSVPEIIATVSEFTALEPGDVLLTGTPGGVGYRREPKVLLADGDELCVEVPGVGVLRNRVEAERVA